MMRGVVITIVPYLTTAPGGTTFVPTSTWMGSMGDPGSMVEDSFTGGIGKITKNR
jgi:hypothetical protein